MKVWVLAENTACCDYFGAEHGLSLYLEALGHKILFDTGQTDLFARNARTLGLDLQTVEAAILSHGHYDHGGGLEHFLNINPSAPVYASPWALRPHYHGEEKYIGIASGLEDCGRWAFVEEHKTLFPGIQILTSPPGRSGTATDGMLVLEDGVFRPDDFRHEVYLLIQEREKRILLSGCSHRGIVEIVRAYRPDVVIGGFHVSKQDPQGDGRAALARLAWELIDTGAVYYTCHCTGLPQFRFLKERMGERIHYLSGGMTLELI